jgi:hypothetical protein
MISSARFRTVLVILRVIVLAFVVALAATHASAQSQPQNAAPATATSSTSEAPSNAAQPATPAPSDAAAKAAERKKRFEEAEKRLEASESAQSGASTTTPSDDKPGSPDDLSISPVLVNMLIGQPQSFSLFDAAGHNLTSKAEWSLSNSSVAELQNSATPTIVSKEAGTVTVHARVGMRSTDAKVTVHSGSSLPIGTVMWQAPPVKGFTPKQIIQAVPTSGPAPQ